MTNRTHPIVGVIMGSQSDWETMEATALALQNLGIAYETKIVSAHRTPHLLVSYATEAAARGIEVIIAGAGGAAHLPGMVAALTHLLVVGVPVESKTLQGLDSLLSIVQMPAGVPVATVAIGKAGATNAGLLAGNILALKYPELSERIQALRKEQTQAVLSTPAPMIKQAPVKQG